MCSAPLLVAHCVTLGKSLTVSGQGEASGECLCRQPSGDKTTRWVSMCPHIWGWAAGGQGGMCRQGKTSHHPSRGPGSVLNCLLQEAEVSSEGGWKEGTKRIQLLFPHPNLSPGDGHCGV